jgi:NAD(P)H-flavin reductase
MQFEEYKIVCITPHFPNVSVLRVKPKNGKHNTQFKPGHFYHIKNASYEKPTETRPFSAITTPLTTEYIEFCIKSYGPWTKELLTKKPGENVWLFGPMGSFTMNAKVTNPIFIAGGVGITPILSILQSLHEGNLLLPVTLIYANKSQDTIFGKEYLEGIFNKKSHWKLLSILSSTPTDKKWKGYQGHITKELLQDSGAITKNSTFFVSGSYRFTKNILSTGTYKKCRGLVDFFPVFINDRYCLSGT